MSGPLRRVTDYDRDRPRPHKRRGLLRRRRFRFLGKQQPSGSSSVSPAAGKTPSPPVTTTLRQLRQLRHIERSFAFDPVPRVEVGMPPPAVQAALRKMRRLRRWEHLGGGL